mgnify:CR=1
MILNVDGQDVEQRDGVWRWTKSGNEAAAEWRPTLDALGYGMYETDESGHIRLATTGAKVYVRFVDSHDAGGVPVPGGRDSGLMFPAKMLGGRVKRVLTGMLDGERVICVWPPVGGIA